MIIAIDGYSSCGKSTVAKSLAMQLGLSYIDSGAMYRSITFYFLQNKIPIPQPNELQNFSFDYKPVLNDIHISFKVNPETKLSEIYLNGKNVEQEIRSMEVSENVSHVSAIKDVRMRMVAMQQQMTSQKNLVMDGRDIGTTVFPNADLKIFMTADANVRAQRRYDELIKKGINVSLDAVKKNLSSRDYEDSNRIESPLKKAADAIVLDNTHLNFDEQVEFVIREIEKINVGEKKSETI